MLPWKVAWRNYLENCLEILPWKIAVKINKDPDFKSHNKWNLGLWIIAKNVLNTAKNATLARILELAHIFVKTH